MATEVFTWYMICCRLFKIHDVIIPTDGSSIFFESVIFRCWYLASGTELWKSALSVYFMRCGGKNQQFNLQSSVSCFILPPSGLSSMVKCMVICVRFICVTSAWAKQFCLLCSVLNNIIIHMFYLQLNINFTKACFDILFYLSSSL